MYGAAMKINSLLSILVFLIVAIFISAVLVHASTWSDTTCHYEGWSLADSRGVTDTLNNSGGCYNSLNSISVDSSGNLNAGDAQCNIADGTSYVWNYSSINSLVVKSWFWDLDNHVWHVADSISLGTGISWTMLSAIAALPDWYSGVSQFDPNALSLGCSEDTANCNDHEPDTDSDLDGICDRCDYAPNIPTVGRYLYETSEIKDRTTGALIGQRVTYFPPEVYVTMPYSAQASEQTLIGSSDGREYPFFSHFPVVGEVPTCVCNQPCQVQSNGDLFGGDITKDGTEAPLLGDTGTTVDQTTLPGQSTPNPEGDTQSGSAAPETGTDNEFLKSIADNSATTASNLDTLNNNLSTQLADIANKVDSSNSDQGDTSTAQNTVADQVDQVASHYSNIEQTIGNALSAEQTTDRMQSSTKFDGTYSRILSVFDNGNCEDLSYDIPIDAVYLGASSILTLDCEYSPAVKTLTSFFFIITTIWSIVRVIVRRTAPPASRLS